MKYFLVSTSPRRIELMKLLEVDFETIKPRFVERMPEDASIEPERFVEEMAEKKCESVLDDSILLEDSVLISADTVVYLEGRIIGKPRDEKDALQILRNLSGKWHSVFTGVCILKNEDKIKFVERTDVFFRNIDERSLKDYVTSGEPLDKAGAYGIQGKGSLFVRRIIGDYYNVMGFPIGRIWEELKRKDWI